MLWQTDAEMGTARGTAGADHDDLERANPVISTAKILFFPF